MAHIPIARTKTIMKTTDGADSIHKDAVYITSRATELFIKELALAGYKDAKNAPDHKLNYNNLVNVVHKDSKYSFLEYMIPKKITVKQYKEMMRKKEEGGSGSGSSEDSDEESTSSNGSSSNSSSDNK